MPISAGLVVGVGGGGSSEYTNATRLVAPSGAGKGAEAPAFLLAAVK